MSEPAPSSAPAPARIKELPEGDRPREKLARQGAASLTDTELIAILLRTGVKGANAVEVARALLLRHGGTLTALTRCTVPEIAKIKGIGSTKAIQLCAAFALGERIAREQVMHVKVDNPEAVERLLGPEMRALHRESLRVVLLDTRHQLQRVEEISLGTLNESLAHPREILRPALLYASYAFILVHNHPSGDPSPSEADRRLTRRISECAALLQINLLDHIIIGQLRATTPGQPAYYSFREHNLL